MLLKKFKESIIQDYIYDLQKDNTFVEFMKNNRNIRGFKFNDNGLDDVLKQTEFKLYVTYDRNNNKNIYSIRFGYFGLFKHKNLKSLNKLYDIAQEKLNTPDYRDKIDMSKKAMELDKNDDDSYDDSGWIPAWGVAVMGFGR